MATGLAVTGKDKAYRDDGLSMAFGRQLEPTPNMIAAPRFIASAIVASRHRRAGQRGGRGDKRAGEVEGGQAGGRSRRRAR